MPKAIVKIVNDKGMHARTAAQFVKSAQQSTNDVVTVSKDNITVDGTSVLSLLTLSASKGTSITIRVTGETADNTLSKLIHLVESGFTEKTSI